MIERAAERAIQFAFVACEMCRGAEAFRHPAPVDVSQRDAGGNELALLLLDVDQTWSPARATRGDRAADARRRRRWTRHDCRSGPAAARARGGHTPRR